jgi:hypothetical protein
MATDREMYNKLWRAEGLRADPGIRNQQPLRIDIDPQHAALARGVCVIASSTLDPKPKTLTKHARANR